MADDIQKRLADMRKQFQQDSDDEKALRENFSINVRFAAGDQWEDEAAARRRKDGRPVMTFNRCHTFVQQVANEARQNKPQIKYIPAEESDQDTAEVYEGLARHIQYSSDAQVAYETAVEYSAGGGFGYFRFMTDYCDDESFDLELKVVPVFDPKAVYGQLLPACFGLEPDHTFITSDMPKEKFQQEYPKSSVTKSWDAEAKDSDGWVGTDTVRIAEYWWVERTKETKTHPTDPSKSRTVFKKTVKFCKTNGVEILDDSETEWPGSCIPIVPVLGKALIVDGKPRLFSVIDFQRDPQKLINYYKTRIAETLALVPVSPWIAPVGGIPQEQKARWSAAAQQNVGVLEYNLQSDVNGKPVDRPSRDTVEPPIQAYSAAAQQEIDDMKATTGIYDASLGSKSNETSGIALARRQQQADVTNLHFMDNLERSFKKGGLIMAEVLPKVYDAPRMVRILGEDETAKIVKINQPHPDANGQVKHYKIGGDDVPEFDVVVTMGKAYSSKRTESYDFVAGLVQSVPNEFQFMADILFANSDSAGADQLAERYKQRGIQQGFIKDDQSGQPEIPPQVQAAMQKMQQDHQALNQYAQDKEKELESYKAGAQVKQMEIESNEKIKFAQIQHEEDMQRLKNELAMALGEMAAKTQDGVARAKLTTDLLSQLQSEGHQLGMQAHAQQHDMNKTAMNQQHQVGMEQMANENAAQQSQENEPAEVTE